MPRALVMWSPRKGWSPLESILDSAKPTRSNTQTRNLSAVEAPCRHLSAALRVDSVVFARKGETLAGRCALTAMPRLLAAGVGAEGEIEWLVQGSVGRDEMQRMREFLRVKVGFSPWMTCSRCLEPVQVRDVTTDTSFRLAASEAQAALEDRVEDSLEVIAGHPALDLAALVEDEAILALPMAPTHDLCEWDPSRGSDRTGDV